MYLGSKPSGTAVVLKNVSNKHLTEKGKENWLSYWRYFSRSENSLCAEKGCTAHHQHGVLVKESDSKTEKLFVVPVCSAHGLNEKVTLVSGNNIDVVSAELCL